MTPTLRMTGPLLCSTASPELPVLLRSILPPLVFTANNRAMSNTRATGTHGEKIAMSFLRKQGLEILEMNYQFGHGEIDIIAKEGEILVFCEVKTRYSDEFGPPECAITERKQAQVRKTAIAYLYEHEIREQICRFDVVAIRVKGSGPEIRYLKNAF